MRLLDAARLELIEATEHYIAVNASLAEDFLDEIDDAFNVVCGQVSIPATSNSR